MRPLAAVPATANAVSPDRTSDTRRRKTTESSTTRMRIAGMRLLSADVQQVEFGYQHFPREGLHDVFVGSRRQRPGHLLRLCLGGHHDETDPVVGAFGPDG